MPEEHQQKITLLLVDDHQIVLDGIKSLLRKTEQIEIVGEALNAKDGLYLIDQHQPDVLLTDINMPGMSGLELAKKVKEEYPDIKVLVLSMNDAHEVIHEIFMANAEGFLLKNTDRKELVEAICKVAEGGTYFSREVLAVLMEKVAPRKPQSSIKLAEKLTPREREILQLIAQEYSTAQIAEALFISPRTVDTHRKHIMHKTQSKTIVGLIRFALDHHLVE